MKNCSEQKHPNSKLSGSGVKRPVTIENENMVLNKKLKSTDFIIETVKTAFKNAAVSWKIKYEEHEDVDMIDDLHGSILSVESNLVK